MFRDFSSRIYTLQKRVFFAASLHHVCSPLTTVVGFLKYQNTCAIDLNSTLLQWQACFFLSFLFSPLTLILTTTPCLCPFSASPSLFLPLTPSSIHLLTLPVFGHREAEWWILLVHFKPLFLCPLSYKQLTVSEEDGVGHDNKYKKTQKNMSMSLRQKCRLSILP